LPSRQSQRSRSAPSSWPKAVRRQYVPAKPLLLVHSKAVEAAAVVVAIAVVAAVAIVAAVQAEQQLHRPNPLLAARMGVIRC
jgi:hypothetical protein